VAELKRTPDYERPPVVETYLGVQFAPLANFSILHFGLYWAKIRENYPTFQVQPSLGRVIEQFGAEKFVQPKLGVELVSAPEVRCWFIEQSGRMLTQVQRDRFIHNWRKLRPEDIYVHYDNIKPRFSEEWKGFCGFLDEAGLGKPEVNQCEMTYVNHIELGQGWESYGELNKVVASWSGSYSGNFLPAPESINIGARYVLPDKQGRLHIEMQPAITQDAKEILQLNLTARGKPKSSNLENILEWFDLGHEWIVRGFTDFTAKEMHEFWGRKI
jgi:uncharacterized protein (TIGR04255 family)